MKKLFAYCFDKWWRPILFWAILSMFVLLSETGKVNGFENFSLELLIAALLGLFISGVYQLVKGRWLKAVATGFLFGGTIAVFILYGLFKFFIETVDGDKWADNLVIPDNIELHLPKEDSLKIHPDSISQLIKTTTSFELYNSFQPGLYEYDLWVNRIESGTVYLKAFEITQEYELSKRTLSKKTLIKVINSTEGIRKFGTTRHFTIYEGDWGKPYAARFELWFKPDNGGNERKLMEKIYKIEGWMR